MHSRTVLWAVLLAAAGVLFAIAAARLREKKNLVDLTVDEIESQIAALDPAVRAGVISRLTADAARGAGAVIHK